MQMPLIAEASDMAQSAIMIVPTELQMVVIASLLRCKFMSPDGASSAYNQNQAATQSCCMMKIAAP